MATSDYSLYRFLYRILTTCLLFYRLVILSFTTLMSSALVIVSEIFLDDAFDEVSSDVDSNAAEDSAVSSSSSSSTTAAVAST